MIQDPLALHAGGVADVLFDLATEEVFVFLLPDVFEVHHVEVAQRIE